MRSAVSRNCALSNWRSSEAINLGVYLKSKKKMLVVVVVVVVVVVGGYSPTQRPGEVVHLYFSDVSCTRTHLLLRNLMFLTLTRRHVGATQQDVCGWGVCFWVGVGVAVGGGWGGWDVSVLCTCTHLDATQHDVSCTGTHLGATQHGDETYNVTARQDACIL